MCSGPELPTAPINSPPADRPAIEAIFPQAELEWIAGAGHWVHTDQPEALLSRLEAFLAKLSPQA